MKTFYLFRHGETYFSKTDLPYGEHELTAGILPEAKPIITKLALYLQEMPIDYAARSEFLRCKETAQIIEHNSEIVFEIDPLLDEFTEKNFDKFHSRMEKLSTKLKKLNYNHIAVCTHGAVVAALQKMLLDESFHAHDLMYFPRTGVIVKISGDTREEIDFN